MTKTMTKELLVRLPEEVYAQLKQFSKEEYKSMASVIRETIIDKLQDTFSKEQLNDIAEQRKEFVGGNGVNWRELKRG